MKQKTSEFETTKAALDFIDSLRKEKVAGYLNLSKNKDGSYAWLVTYTPKKGMKFE
jgi:hypothetical protein